MVGGLGLMRRLQPDPNPKAVRAEVLASGLTVRAVFLSAVAPAGLSDWLLTDAAGGALADANYGTITGYTKVHEAELSAAPVAGVFTRSQFVDAGYARTPGGAVTRAQTIAAANGTA